MKSALAPIIGAEPPEPAPEQTTPENQPSPDEGPMMTKDELTEVSKAVATAVVAAMKSTDAPAAPAPDPAAPAPTPAPTAPPATTDAAPADAPAASADSVTDAAIDKAVAKALADSNVINDAVAKAIAKGVTETGGTAANVASEEENFA